MSKHAISTAIENKLNEQVGAGKVLKVVYGEHKLDVSGYPCATFEPSDFDSDYETTTQNLRKYVFRIMLHQQFKTIAKTEAIRRLNIAVDVIVHEFEKDYTLGGTVDMLKIIPNIDGQYDRKGNPVRFSEIVLEAYKSIDITT